MRSPSGIGPRAIEMIWLSARRFAWLASACCAKETSAEEAPLSCTFGASWTTWREDAQPTTPNRQAMAKSTLIPTMANLKWAKLDLAYLGFFAAYFFSSRED